MEMGGRGRGQAICLTVLYLYTCPPHHFTQLKHKWNFVSYSILNYILLRALATIFNGVTRDNATTRPRDIRKKRLSLGGKKVIRHHS